MKDYSNKDHISGSHLEGMEAKHAKKMEGSFYHNVAPRNLMKGGHSVEHAEMKDAGHKSSY